METVFCNKTTIFSYIPFPCVSGTPIQRAKDLVQENQALLNTIPAISQDRGPSRGFETSSRGTETNNVPQRDFALYTPNGRRGRGRGRRGREGRGGKHQDMLKCRPTLLEMVRWRHLTLNWIHLLGQIFSGFT